MVSGGAALSGELWFGLFLIVFAALTCFSLAYGVIGRVMAEGAEFPSRPIGRQIGPGLLSGLLLAATFFVLFPRLSWNFAGRNVAPGLGSPTSGFAESVRLGGAGSIKTNPRAVFRAKLNPDPGVEELSAYWVGRTFDRFDGVEWRGAGEPRPAAKPGRPRPLERPARPPADRAAPRLRLERPRRARGAGAGRKRDRTPGPEQLPRRGGRGRGEQVRFASPALGYSYHAYSRASSEGMSAPGSDLSRHLGLPETLDPRVRALAREVVGDERDPLRAAERLEAYLQTNYRYTLELEGNPADPLADFLFVRKAGHCEHFATALAVLLRAAGFPARVASGFYGGHRSGDEYVVRAGDAHAWAQVYVPRRGFVSVDATPEEARLAQPMPWLAWFAAQYEALDGLWRNHVLDYSMRDQIGLARGLSRPVVLPGGRWLPALRPVAGVALAILALVLGWRALGTGRKRRARAPRRPSCSTPPSGCSGRPGSRRRRGGRSRSSRAPSSSSGTRSRLRSSGSPAATSRRASATPRSGPARRTS